MENQPVQNVEIFPSNQKAIYNQFDNVEFVLDGYENRSILKNSICIEGDLRCLLGANDLQRINLQGVFYDSLSGVHGLVDTLFVETLNQNSLETINNYPRLIAMKNSTTQTQNDMVKLSDAVELVYPSLTMSNEIVRGLQFERGGANAVAQSDVQDISFSFNPYCCVNRTQQDIPFGKTGSVRLNLILARNSDFFHGQAVQDNSTLNYQIRNLKLRFKTVPSVNEKDPILLNVVYNIKNSINSPFMNIHAKVPSVIKSVNASFMKQTSEGSLRLNTKGQEILPNLQTLQFYFNDAVSGQGITYTIDTINEMVKRYLESWGDNSGTQISEKNYDSGESFGIGTNFGANIPLMNDTFSIQVRSDANNVNPFLIYLYFYGILQI